MLYTVLYYLSTAVSYLPAVVFAIGIVLALVTKRRQPRRSVLALIGFLVLLVGYLAVRIYELFFFSYDSSGYAINILIYRGGYLVVLAVGLALLVAAVFVVPSQRPDAPTAPPAWGPPQAHHPQPGRPGGSW